MNNYLLLVPMVAFGFVGRVRAFDINGTVAGAQSDTVQITTQSELLPNVGDPVTVFFKIPGSDDEILVGSGSVTAIKGGVISAKLEKATAKPQKDQLARITSEKPQAKPASASAVPSPLPAASGLREANPEDAARTKAAAQDVQSCRQAAEKGDATAQVTLGKLNATGQGVPKDLGEAVKWYRKAAEQGNADGQFRFGRSYDLGEGIEKDPIEAVHWYRQAAAQNNS